MLLALVACGSALPRAATRRRAAGEPVLHLAGGGFVAGTFRDTDGPGMLRWQGRAFRPRSTSTLKAVDAVQVSRPGPPPRSRGRLPLRAARGATSCSGPGRARRDEADLDLPRIGRLRIQRSHLLRIERWRDRADLVYLGPNGLAGWTRDPADGPNAWREESGELVTDSEGAALFDDIGLPARAAFEFELSWKSKPDFVLSLGVGAGREDRPSGVPVRGLGRRPGRPARDASRRPTWRPWRNVTPRLRPRPSQSAYLDQERGRIVVDSPDGKPLADLKVAEPKPRVLTGVRLENKNGRRAARTARGHPVERRAARARPRPDGPTLRRNDGSNVSAKGVRLRRRVEVVRHPRWGQGVASSPGTRSPA